MAYMDDVAEWYGKVLDTHGAYMPDLDAKRTILAERNTWAARGAASGAPRTAGVISLQWDTVVYHLAHSERARVAGWAPEWDDLLWR